MKNDYLNTCNDHKNCQVNFNNLTEAISALELLKNKTN